MQMSDPENDFERIVPAAVELTRDESLPPPIPRPKSRLEPILWGSVLAALSIAVGIVLFLPEFEADVVVDDQPLESGTREAPAGAGIATSSQETLSPFEQAQRQKERKAAQDILEELVEQQYLLEDMSVEIWGQEDLAAALVVAQEGDDVFLTRDYEGAANRYREARSRLDELVSRGTRLYEDQLAQGFEALDDGDVTAARSAFEMATAIDRDSSEARRGIERAAKLNQVLALLAQAEELTTEAHFEDALARYQQVLEIDPDTTGVEDAIATTRQAIRDQSFRRSMTRGYAGLSAGDHARARTAFEQARRISNNSEARDALTEVDMQLTLATIAKHQQAAETAVAEERWRDAIAEFEAALAVDATLLFAVDGLPGARSRARLDDELSEILATPGRLSADDAYRNAAEVFRRGVAVEDPGSRFTGQLDQLESLLELYQKPVAVSFRSDNATDVTLLKVARLGRFSRRELQLRPGFYTVVGARNGYRDVRREIEVLAGEPTPPISIRCDEKI